MTQAYSDERIPTLDLALHRDPATRADFVARLGRAAEVYGFVLIRNHGIPPEVMADAFGEGRRFFEMPEVEKRRVLDVSRSDRGYQPLFDSYDGDGKPSAQEGFTMSHPVRPADATLAALSFYAPTPWPDLPRFRPAFETLYGALFALGRDLLDAMAQHLDAPAGFFEPGLRDTYSHMRINHYPPQDAVAHVSDEGVFAHFDESLLTLLLQDTNSGLQVMGHDGRWIVVEPDPTAVVVNVGKMLRHWTGGRYNAALHRVVNVSGRDRYSIPLFMHPGFNTVVDPRALAHGRAVPDEYAPIVAGRQVFESFASTRKSWQEAEA